MKVLMIVDPFHPCPQSSSQRLHSFAQALSHKGFRVTVIAGNRCLGTMGNAPPLKENIAVYDLKCPFFLFSFSSITINPLLLIMYSCFSAIILLRERANAVFASVPNGETATAGLLVSKIFRIPFVVDLRDLYPFPSPREMHVPISPYMSRLLMRWFSFLYKNSDVIVCAYTTIKSELRKAGVLAEKIFVVTNGADTSIYRPRSYKGREAIRIKYGLPLDELIFVYAGTLASYYPTHDLIKGFSKIYQKEKKAQLLIISFRNYDRYERIAEELKLKGAVRFMGPFPVVETAEILSACDIGVVLFPGNASVKEMYGAKIFSYMSCGLPVLASGPQSGIIGDLIQDSGAGFFVGKPCANSFAKGFSFFLKNVNEIKIMGENARKLIEEHYDRRELGSKLASRLYEVCRREESKRKAR